MRILLVSNHHGNLAGGAVAMMRSTEELLRGAGHDVIPFAIREDTNFASPAEAYFPRVRDLRRQPLPSDRTGASPYSFPARRRIHQVVKDHLPDVAHLHNAFGKLTLAVVDGLHHASVPVVMTLHDYKPVCPNGVLFTHDGICQRCLSGGRFWNAVRHRCVDGSVYRSSIAAAEAYVNRFRRMWDKIDVFITPSAFLRDVVVAGGLPPERVEVVPNPVPAAPDLRERKVDERIVVYSGRLIPHKGLDVLLEAAGLARNVRVVVYGIGALEQHLRDRVERERLPVEIRGYADKATIRRQLDRCVAAVVPSVWFENCPMAILEASARGVATVASDLGGMTELISHKESGILVPPGDATALASALVELSDDESWAADLGRNAWEQVRERHDPDRYIKDVVALYERAAVDRM